MRTSTGPRAVASAALLLTMPTMLAVLTLAGCGSSSSRPSTAPAASSGAPASGIPATPSAPASGSQPSAPPSNPSSTPSVDPGTLPQTKTMPTATDAQFQAGVNALWQGIVDDDPQEALPFFFPKSA